MSWSESQRSSSVSCHLLYARAGIRWDVVCGEVHGAELTSTGEPACGGPAGQNRRDEDGAEFHDKRNRRGWIRTVRLM